jgi:hypothetical protein
MKWIETSSIVVLWMKHVMDFHCIFLFFKILCSRKMHVGPWLKSIELQGIHPTININTICWNNHDNKPFCVSTTRNPIICNLSMCDYVQLDIACDYKWLPMQLLFKFGWTLVFFSTRLRLWPISSLTCVIFYNVFVFFTTLYIHLIANVTKIITC